MAKEVTVGHVWNLIDAHMKSGPYDASLRKVALRLGVSPSTLGNWRDDITLPEQRFLSRIAELVGVSEAVVFDAWSEDARAKIVDAPKQAARTPKPKSKGRGMRKAQDDAGEAPDNEGPEFGA